MACLSNYSQYGTIIIEEFRTSFGKGLSIQRYSTRKFELYLCFGNKVSAI